MNTITELGKSKCCGCGCCAQSCPKSCISMRADERGFLHPIIDSERCIQCRKCVQICPVIHNIQKVRVEKSDSLPEVYAAWSLDESIRYKSTSGGVFTELAREILRQGGCVIGARYSNRFLVEHTLIECEQEVELLRQSKYVQSETKDIYKQAKKQLDMGKMTLFVGTPCQCAALRSFLGKEYEELLLCDFICRGVNSPLIFRTYLDELEERYDSKVKQVWFKNKTYGWNKFGTKIIFENGQEYFGSRNEDDFMYGFIRKNLNLYMRSSCNDCCFKGVQRPVDITLGDFWGIRAEEEKDLGVSVVMLHTEHGRTFFQKLNSVMYQRKSVDDVIRGNSCLVESARASKITDAFWRAWEKERSFHEIIEKMKNSIIQEEQKNE